MELKKEHSAYSPAAKTNVMVTFRRMGWTPPSEMPETIEKWSYYKHLSLLSEEALNHESKS